MGAVPFSYRLAVFVVNPAASIVSINLFNDLLFPLMKDKFMKVVVRLLDTVTGVFGSMENISLNIPASNMWSENVRSRVV